MKYNFIPMARPSLGTDELDLIGKVIRSGMISQGEVVAEFEKKFADYVGVKHAVALSSGTAALYLSLIALNIGKGDEVITTPFSFIATTNTIIQAGAKPVFVDIDPETFNIDVDKIEDKITSRTKAILPVHLYGLPADMPRIKRIARKYKIRIIEDACQAHGAMIGSDCAGSFGDAGCFSFYPTKNITTAEGGMVVTNSSKIAQEIRVLRNQGMVQRYDYRRIGFNLRMTDIHAAIGIAQLKGAEMFTKKRIENASYYLQRLEKIVDCPIIQDGYKHVFHQYTLKIRKNRDRIRSALKLKGVDSAVYYPAPLHKEKIYKDYGFYKLSLPVSEEISKQVLSIPIHPGLTVADREVVSDSIEEIIQNL